METITQTRVIKIQNDTKHALNWLDREYPRGVELIYVDYRDSYEDEATLQAVLKSDEDENWDWQGDNQHESINEIIRNYKNEIEIEEITDEVEEAIRDLCLEHDTSNPTKELLKHTGRKLCYIETEDYSEEDKGNFKELLKKYGKTDEQKKEIKYVINEQFYGSLVSFYFYIDVERLFEAIHVSSSKYIRIEGAYFTTIDRVQGSNWIGEKAVFTLTIPRKEFIENFYLDGAKGNGYGWGEIAGQTGYDEAEIITTNTKKRGSILLYPRTSESQKREMELAENWKKTKKCIFGDMNWERHTGKWEYINNYPCGHKCENCGTFWVD